MMTGDDFPDIMHLSTAGYAVAPNLPAFFKSKCANLRRICRATRPRTIRTSPRSRNRDGRTRCPSWTARCSWCRSIVRCSRSSHGAATSSATSTCGIGSSARLRTQQRRRRQARADPAQSTEAKAAGRSATSGAMTPCWPVVQMNEQLEAGRKPTANSSRTVKKTNERMRIRPRAFGADSFHKRIRPPSRALASHSSPSGSRVSLEGQGNNVERFLAARPAQQNPQ